MSKATVLVSPGCSAIFWNPFSSFTGRVAELIGVADIHLDHLGAGAIAGVGDFDGDPRGCAVPDLLLRQPHVLEMLNVV